MRIKYTREILAHAISVNQSMAGVMRYLGAKQSGGLHYHLLLRARTWGIDMSHFVGQAGSANKMRRSFVSIPLEDYCVEHSKCSRNNFKRRLISEGKLKKECAVCGLPPEWKNLKLVLVLDHINGIRDDNRLENLRLLCPNCNSQTTTFCGKNFILPPRICSRGCGRKIRKDSKTGLCSRCLFKDGLKKLECPVCHGVKRRTTILCDKCTKEGRVPELAAGESFRNSCESLVGSSPTSPTISSDSFCVCGRVKTVKAPRCRRCTNENNRKVKRPSLEELKKMRDEMPMTIIAAKYGVSDNAVRKWFR